MLCHSYFFHETDCIKLLNSLQNVPPLNTSLYMLQSKLIDFTMLEFSLCIIEIRREELKNCTIETI